MPVQENVFSEPFSPTMSREVQVKRWILSKQTSYQRVDVVDTYDYGITLFIDRFFQTSERDEFFYHESLVHPAMMTHDHPRSVLIIGGSAGFVAENEPLQKRAPTPNSPNDYRWGVVDVISEPLKNSNANTGDSPEYLTLLSTRPLQIRTAMSSYSGEPSR